MADLSVATAAWSGLAGAASVATLLALAGILLSIASLWRLRTHYRLTEAAERSEMVGLSAIVQRYVPGELQSHRTSDEIAIVKQVICLRRTRWTRAAIILGALMLFSVAAAAHFTRRNLELLVQGDPVVRAGPNLDVMKLVQGNWGWRADFRQSCSQNPQTISVSPDGDRVSLDYARPYWTQQHFEYSVYSARANKIVLKLLNAAPSPDSHPVTLTITFLDANTFLLENSNKPLESYGTMERCK